MGLGGGAPAHLESVEVTIVAFVEESGAKWGGSGKAGVWWEEGGWVTL